MDENEYEEFLGLSKCIQVKVLIPSLSFLEHIVMEELGQN